MPITFAPADPLDAQAAYGYGRTQRQQADRDFALRQQQVAQQASAASYGTANQAAAIDNQAREAGDALRQRQQEFALSRQPSEADAYAVRAQQAAVQQRFELQAWLQDQELSQAEKVRYQRMQNAVGTVENGDYTPDEKRDLLTQLRTGIDAGKQRLERATARQKLALEQQEVERGHRDAAMTKAFEATMTTGGPKTYPIELPDGSQAVAYFANPREGWKIHAPKAAKAEARKDDFGRTPQDYQKAASDVEAKLDKWVADQKKANPSFNITEQDYYKNFLNGMKLRGFKGSFEEHFAGKGTAGGGQPGPVVDQGDGQGNAPPPGGGTPEPPEVRQKRVTNLAAGYFRAAETLKARPDLPPEKRLEYAAAAVKVQNLVALYGSAAEMPKAAREEYDRLKAVLQAIPDDPRSKYLRLPADAGNAASYQ